MTENESPWKFWGHFSDKNPCSKLVQVGNHDCMCMRVEGHDGGCDAMAGTAAKADGIGCWLCRVAEGEPHRGDCTLRKETP